MEEVKDNKTIGDLADFEKVAKRNEGDDDRWRAARSHHQDRM